MKSLTKGFTSSFFHDKAERLIDHAERKVSANPAS
jgi:hypothetical protein